MAKQLRLDVAQLTDVGRKREHNEDNMAYVIPKDPLVMAKKGALFIVADGMGGHAAGEVASEIAVDTVSNVYYQDDSEDVAVSLLHAIKRANALIHQRASENMLRSGMGTTCVAGVLRGNIAYIANVGDSRAYFVRNGQVKQVSMDHSWVAEQVRAGLLTEDQARTHAQRNVITRCLGTQSDVEVDIFSEELEEGDSLVLCTDGLSGMVPDDEIRRIVAQFMPQESVYHLVERANDNGGTDNITAIVVRVQEVGVEPNGRRPVRVGVRETGEDSALLSMPGSASFYASRINDLRTPSSPLRSPSGQLISPDSDTAPQPALRISGPKRNRLFLPSLALLILLIVALAGGGVYYFFKMNSGLNVDQTLQDAQNLVTQAKGEVTARNPTGALQDLSRAQTKLHDVQNATLTDAQRAKLTTLLNGDFTTTFRSAVISYNQMALITNLPCSSTPTNTTINEGSTGTHAKQFAYVQDGKNSFLYTLGQDGGLYLLKDNSLVERLSSSALNADNSQIQALAGNDTRLFLLWSIPAKGTTQGSYMLSLLPAGTTQPTKTMQIDTNLIQHGQLPTMLTAWDNDVYVVLTSQTVSNNALILDYGVDLSQPPKQLTISVSTSIVSVAAFPNHQLFLLLADGSVQSLKFMGANQAATSVLVPSPIPSVLPVNDKDVTSKTPVPTVQQLGQGKTTPLAVSPSSTGSTSTATTPTASLFAGLISSGDTKVPYLFVADSMTHRILILKSTDQTPISTPTPTPTPAKTATVTASPNATVSVSPTPVSTTGGGVPTGQNDNNVTLQLVEQLVSPGLFAQVSSLALDPKGLSLNVLAQTDKNVYNNIPIDLSTPSNGCV